MMQKKCFILLILLFVTFCPFSMGKVKCYAGTNCKYSPKNADGPDLSKCEKVDCDHGCGRTWQGRLVSPFSFGGGAPEPEKTKTRAKRQFGGNPMDLLSEIQLGCVGKKTKDDSCKKMTKEKGICVCTKELCNSASNAAPATFILLIWWIFAMIR